MWTHCFAKNHDSTSKRPLNQLKGLFPIATSTGCCHPFSPVSKLQEQDSSPCHRSSADISNCLKGAASMQQFSCKAPRWSNYPKKTPASVPSFEHFNTGGHCAQQSAEWTVLSMANGHRVALFGIMAPEVVGSGRKIFCRLVLRRASNVSHPKRHVHRQGHRYKEATNYCHSPAPKYDPPRF